MVGFFLLASGLDNNLVEDCGEESSDERAQPHDTVISEVPGDQRGAECPGGVDGAVGDGDQHAMGHGHAKALEGKKMSDQSDEELQKGYSGQELTNGHSRMGFSKVCKADMLVVIVDGCRNSEDQKGGADDLTNECRSKSVFVLFAVHLVPMRRRG